MLSVRPKVAELVFQLYGRALHPELFEVHSTRTVKRGDYEATVNITSAGHVVTWRYQGLTLTEVATSAHHPLPQKRRIHNANNGIIPDRKANISICGFEQIRVR